MRRRTLEGHPACFRPTRRMIAKGLVLAVLAGRYTLPALADTGHARVSDQVSSESIVLDATLTIVESANEPGPVRLATENLADDFQTVLGKRPVIIDHPVDAAPVAILVGEQSKIPDALRSPGLTGTESFSIAARMVDWSQRRRTKVVVLTGADMRGTIYAIYQFSEAYLGIDPLYYWTDRQPGHRASIKIPLSLHQRFSPPLFKYRGFFINDEDLLTGWAPGEEKDKTGISLAVWDKIFETILRLHGNMVAPGTWIFPDDPQVREAAKCGLIVTQHHATPLGLNVARWPQDVPYDYATRPEILERGWKNAVNSYLPDQQVLWEVGLRGLSDVGYGPKGTTERDHDKALGQLIGTAMADQISIVRSVRPEAKFVTNLWQEGARLVRQGDLKIPPEVSTLWTDDGYGYLQDHGEVTAGQGIYDHVAYMNGGANQLTEMVPVERHFSELGRYIRAGATEYFLVNTSDIRPVTMSIRAVMDAVWKGLPGGDDPADEFYREWSVEEFGEEAAPRLVELYKEYFKAPAHFGDPEHEYGDQYYHTEVRQMLLTYMIDSPLYALPSQSPKWMPAHFFNGFETGHAVGEELLGKVLEREIERCGAAQARWDSAWTKAIALEPLIPVSRHPFYHAQVLAMISINRESNRILLLVSKAIQDAKNGNRPEAHANLDQALKAFDEIQRAETAAEYGKWKQWYRGDWLTGIYRTRQIVALFCQFLDDPLTHIAPPLIWDGWEAYYHIMHYEGDRSADVK
jgi:Glycosyl hydrolase family 115